MIARLFTPPCVSRAALVMLHIRLFVKRPKTVKKLWKTGKKVLDLQGGMLYNNQAPVLGALR